MELLIQFYNVSIINIATIFLSYTVKIFGRNMTVTVDISLHRCIFSDR